MKAFPEIIELSEQYQYTELKVIYLNTDERPERWERALTFTDNLHLPDHYRVRYPDFGILSRAGLNVYPRYLVMEGEGRIIKFRAPVPNKDYVDSLLMKNVK